MDVGELVEDEQVRSQCHSSHSQKTVFQIMVYLLMVIIVSGV